MVIDPSRKPLRWIGSSRRDLRALPESVKSRLGYALYVAQQGGKHRDAKPLKGFGGAGVVEIVTDFDGNTFRGRSGIRAPCLPEEVQDGTCNAETGIGPDQAAAARSGADCAKRRAMKKKLDYEPGSGNVFADIGLPNAQEHLIKAQLVYKIDGLMKAGGLTQVSAAKLFGVKQPDVSKMLRGDFRQFSVERLLRFLVALGQDVDIAVKPHRGARSAPQLRVTDESADTQRLKRSERELRTPIRSQPSSELNLVEHGLSAMESQDSLTLNAKGRATSTELTGGSGFTYEDLVVGYYLSALLRRERAAGETGFVTSVAVQQQGHGNPMDDLVVEFDDLGTKRVLALQIKRSMTISGAASNAEFRGIISTAIKTQALGTFTKGADKCGFVVEHVTAGTFRTLTRLSDWAKAGTAGSDFEVRFSPMGNAGADERNLRSALLSLIGASNSDEEVSFYQHFVALHLSGLEEGGVLRMEVVNRLQEIIAVNEDGQDVLLFDRLCRIARDGAAKATKWTRASLLAQLRSAVRLKVIPYLGDDINRLNA